MKSRLDCAGLDESEFDGLSTLAEEFELLLSALALPDDCAIATAFCFALFIEKLHKTLKKSFYTIRECVSGRNKEIESAVRAKIQIFFKPEVREGRQSILHKMTTLSHVLFKSNRNSFKMLWMKKEFRCVFHR